MKKLEINVDNMPKFDLKKEYQKVLKDPVVAKIVKGLKLPDEILMENTTMLEKAGCEYHNCLECKSLATCPNKVKGHVYMPINVDGNLNFEYRPCKYYRKLKQNTEYLDRVTYLGLPDALKEASISKIHKTDKNRFDTILWINNFYKDYPNNQHLKGLYLHGNFGCGKSYIISALFNDLARDGYHSMIIFWPEFVRGAFLDNFNDNFMKAKETPLLLIDDIGAEHITDWNRDEILCPLLQYRMDNHLPTFFTSNLSLEQLEEFLAYSKSGVDAVKASRIIARIKQLTETKEMLSKNLRN